MGAAAPLRRQEEIEIDLLKKKRVIERLSLFAGANLIKAKKS